MVKSNGNGNVYYTLDFQEHKALSLNGQYTVVDNNAIIESYGSDTYYVGEGDTLISNCRKNIWRFDEMELFNARK